jgi:hypothetical protein
MRQQQRTNRWQRNNKGRNGRALLTVPTVVWLSVIWGDSVMWGSSVSGAAALSMDGLGDSDGTIQ